MPNNLTESCEPLRAGDFDGLERLIKMDVPDAIKKFYMLGNGGVLEKSCWQPDETEPLCISEVLPIKYPLPDGRTVESTFQGLTAKNVLLSGIVPFAKDWGGNFFCFTSEGSIVFYAMDAWTPKLSIEDNKLKAAKPLRVSFTAFIDGLTAEDV